MLDSIVGPETMGNKQGGRWQSTALGERMGAMRRVAAPVAALGIVGIDLLVLRRVPRPIRGVLDEVAHLATAVLLVDILRPQVPDPWLAGALAGSILLDVDHLPGEFGCGWLAAPGERPYPHSALFAFALFGLGYGLGGWPGTAIRGVACGLATHLFRDLATGGCLLGWPLVRRSVALPYPVYAAALVLAAFGRAAQPSVRP